MTNSKSLDLPLAVALGTACALAGYVFSLKTSPATPPPQSATAAAPPPQPAANAEPAPPATPEGRPHSRSRSNSLGSAKDEGERTIQLVIKDSASRNTVESLLSELSKLQSKSSDMKLSRVKGFSDSFGDLTELMPENEMSLPKRGGDQPAGVLNIATLRAKMTLRDADMRDKRVLVRVDYNCPTDDKTQTITDTSRIDTTIPSLRAIFDGGARCVVIIAHRGRPGGSYSRANFTLEPCVAVLKEHFPEREIKFLPECAGPSIEAATKECAPGTILLLEVRPRCFVQPRAQPRSLVRVLSACPGELE